MDSEQNSLLEAAMLERVECGQIKIKHPPQRVALVRTNSDKVLRADIKVKGERRE